MAAASPVAGYILALIQAVLYACMGIIGKYLYGTGLNPQQVMVLRFVMTFVILGAFLLVWRKQKLFSRRPLVYVQGVFFMSSALFYFLAVDEVSAGLATALLYAYPAVVAFLTAIVFREKLTKRTVAAVVLALGGIIAIAGILEGTVTLSPIGILYGVAACVTFAIYTVIGQKVVEKEGSFTITFSLTTVSLVMLVFMFPTTFPELLSFTPLQLGLGATMAVFTTILPVVALLAAIKIIGATKAALISIAETPISLGLAYLMFGETLTIMQGVGCVLIVASIFAVTLPQRTKKLPAEKAEKDE